MGPVPWLLPAELFAMDKCAKGSGAAARLKPPPPPPPPPLKPPPPLPTPTPPRALAGPQLGSRPFSGRAWRLWAARHSQERGRPTGRPATASAARASRLLSRHFQRP